MAAHHLAMRLGATAAEQQADRALAGRLGLPVLGPQEEAAAPITHLLDRRDGRLCLCANAPGAPSPTCVDFLAAPLDYRRRTSGKSQGIARAVGVKKLGAPRVLDATAGLGRDAFILAALGCRVIMLERSPLIHALLADGLERGRRESEGELAHILAGLELHLGEALAWCEARGRAAAEAPDVIYLDPMFPARAKSASVKKDIAMLQQMLGPDHDVARVLALARRCARHRVVVKQPGGKGGGDLPPADFTVPGKACRFDVYLCHEPGNDAAP